MMKYIRTKNKGIIIFSDNLNHSDMWAAMKNQSLESGTTDDLVSAGIIGCIDEDALSCYGESLSLGLSSEAEDTQMLRRKLCP